MFHFKLTNRRSRVGEVLSKRVQLEDAHFRRGSRGGEMGEFSSPFF